MNMRVKDPEPEKARIKRVLDALIELICLDTSMPFKQVCMRRYNEIQGELPLVVEVLK